MVKYLLYAIYSYSFKEVSNRFFLCQCINGGNSLRILNRSKSMFFKLMVSYVILLSIVLCTMYPIYVKTLKIVKEQAIRDSHFVFEKGLDTLDSYIDGIDKTIYNLYFSNDINKLSTIKPAINMEETYRIISAQKYFHSVFSPYDIVKDAFIVFKNSNSAITMKRYYNSADKFNEFFYGEENIDALNRDLLQGYRNREFIKERKIVEDEGTNNYVVPYLTSLPIGSVNNFDSMVGVLIDREKLLKLFLSEDINTNGWLYMTDSNGNIILTWNYDGKILDFKGNGFTELKINNEKTTVIYRSSPLKQINIVAGIPQKVFIKKVSGISSFFYIYFGLAIIVGIFIALVLAYQNSRPFQKLILYLDSIGLKSKDGKNEITYLENAITQLYNSKEELDEELLHQRNVAKHGMIERLLRNGVYAQKDIKLALEYLPEMPESYRIIAIKYGFSKLDNSSSENIDYGIDLLQAALVNFIKEELKEEVIIHPSGKGILTVILPQTDDSESKPSIEESLILINNNMIKNCGENIICGISSYCIGINNLGKAFSEAQKALGYLTLENEVFIWYEKPCFNSCGTSFDFYDSQRLFQLLIVGEKESILTLLNETISKNRDIISSNNKMAYQLYQMLRNTIIFAKKELQNIKADIIIPEYIEEAHALKQFEELFESCKAICDEINNNKRSHNNSLKDGIILYISENYSDPDLCAEMISKKFSISEKYLFNFLKEQTGKSFGSYLESIRMENAIKLIKETDKPITQIAIEVGFLSQNSFYKAFKRVYGTSPSAYKKAASQLKGD